MIPIYSEMAPEALGPYSQAIKIGNLVFCSGQVGINRATGILVSDSLEAEARQVMENIGHVLRAAGTDYSKVLKATIFLLDMGRFAEINSIYGSYFSLPFPARETVQVSALPAGARIEISVIAAVD